MIQDGRIVYTQGYGLADLEQHKPVRTSSVFNWASNSKPVMAVAAMQLVQAGQLDLNASVRQYLPALSETLQAVQVRHLLCHQSGIPHYSNGRVIPARSVPVDRDEQDPLVAINRFTGSPLLYEPGSRTSYSSYAYVLLSAVVQAAGGERLQQQLDTRIIDRLQLTSFQLDLPYHGQADWTLAYRLNRGGQPTRVPDTAHYWKHGAGGYKSNIQDFARFALALMNKELINDQTTQRMWTPQKTSDGATTQYGLGVSVSGSGSALRISHNGGQDETKTRMVFYPARRHGLVVMCNSAQADPGQITTAVYRASRPRRARQRIITHPHTQKNAEPSGSAHIDIIPSATCVLLCAIDRRGSSSPTSLDQYRSRPYPPPPPPDAARAVWLR